jgi:hypothetical protein
MSGQLARRVPLSRDRSRVELPMPRRAIARSVLLRSESRPNPNVAPLDGEPANEVAPGAAGIAVVEVG